MANSNPYLKDEKEQNSLADNASKVSAGAGVVAAVGTIVSNKMNPLKWFSSDNPLNELTKTGTISTIAAGVAAIPDAIEAVQELGKGNVVGAGRKAIRGVCNAAITVLPLTAILNVASQMITGDSIVDHMGNIANNATSVFTGGDKAKDAKVENAISVPAAAAVIGGGVLAAGLAANNFKGKNDAEYTAGGLPNGANGKIISNEPQAIKGVAQVASVDYPKQKAIEQDNTAQVTQEQLNPFAEKNDKVPERYFINQYENSKGFTRGTGLKVGARAVQNDNQFKGNLADPEIALRDTSKLLFTDKMAQQAVERAALAEQGAAVG